MDKNDILDYVTKTPANTNRAVLGGMLDSYAGSGGSSLPSVTSDDNGKVLTVVEGTWDKAEASGGEVSTDYITMSWTTEHGPGCGIRGTFCRYEFESSLSFERDAETQSVDIMVGEIYTAPEEENPLPAEMFEICSYVLLNKLWSMFGDDTKRIDYNNRLFGSSQTLYDAFDGFDETFTVSL